MRPISLGLANKILTHLLYVFLKLSHMLFSVFRVYNLCDSLEAYYPDVCVSLPVSCFKFNHMYKH